MPYCQSDDRHPSAIQNRGTVQMCPSQMRLDHEHDAMLSQEFLYEPWTTIEYAHMRDLLKEIVRQAARDKIDFGRFF